MIANKNQPAKKLAVVFWFGFEGLKKGKTTQTEITIKCHSCNVAM